MRLTQYALLTLALARGSYASCNNKVEFGGEAVIEPRAGEILHVRMPSIGNAGDEGVAELQVMGVTVRQKIFTVADAGLIPLHIPHTIPAGVAAKVKVTVTGAHGGVIGCQASKIEVSNKPKLPHLSPLPQLRRVVEPSFVHTREDWSAKSRAPPSSTHEVVFAIKQNSELLHKALLEVSTPGSPKKGKYLTYDEAHMLGSNPKATAAVKSFLEEHESVEITSVHKHGLYINAKATVSTWESIFNAQFSIFHHGETGHKVIRASTDVSLPFSLADHLEGVLYTTQVPPRRFQKLAPRKMLPSEVKAMAMGINSTSTASSVTPSLLKSFYNIGSATGSQDVSQSLFESLGQYFSPADLASFQSQFNLPSQQVANDIGGHSSDTQCANNPNNCGEANLDVQYIMAIAPGTPTTFWYENNEQTPFVSWIQAVAADSNPPLVHSISYGSIEKELASTVTTTFNNEAMKLGLQGVTVVASSGDDGVANFQARQNANMCGYNPSFPASSPYVTSVGATQGIETSSPQTACSSATSGTITTGGGFSTVYDAPNYQSDAISSYFNNVGEAPESGYSTTGRGYPDVSMSGHNYVAAISGNFYLVSGTSASAPVVAGIATLVNAQLIAAGQPSLGFINPTIYKAGSSSFNDITTGNNKCTASSICCTQGFTASSGWDPLTGLGTVDYVKFQNIFLSEEAKSQPKNVVESVVSDISNIFKSIF